MTIEERNEEEFAPEIKTIENRMIKFLCKSPLFMGQNPLLTKIKAFFATRKDLTQAELQKLTGYSSGAISQALKTLVDEGFIKKERSESRGKITYSMRSVELAYIRANVEGLKQTLLLGEDLIKIKSDLDEDKEELQDENGFKAIYKWAEIFWDFLVDPSITKLVNGLEERIVKLEEDLMK